MAARKLGNRRRNHHKDPFCPSWNKHEIQVRKLVFAFFKGDALKLKEWLETKNPLLGDRTPESMLRQGHGNKLLKWVKNQLAENVP